MQWKTSSYEGYSYLLTHISLEYFITDYTVQHKIFRKTTRIDWLTGRRERIPAIGKRQPQGCGCRAYRDVFTAASQLWVSFSFYTFQ